MTDDEPNRVIARANELMTPLTLDVSAYAHYLEGTDWTEAQKHEFIVAMWQVMVGFVDLAFARSLLSQADNTLLELDSPSVINSNDTIETADESDVARAVARAMQRSDS